MARYADRLLADGERIALRGRQHVLAPIIDGRIAWAILIASIVLVFLSGQLQRGIARDIFGWIGLALLLGSLVWLGYVFLRWYSTEYMVTNRRVVNVSGILNKRSADSSLEKINDAVLEQSILGRMFGFGDLDILTANEESVDRYRLLGQAQTFKKTMLDQKHRLEQEVFQVPAPPLRATAPTPPPAAPAAPVGLPGGGVAVATPTAAPAAPPAKAMTAEEITRALGDLADLRDRGAISAEEYEAKKQDLLGRL
ncbi:MAG: hypothetical protein FIA92_01035 [Chloroflexi bacterium]|nr:hypothetical protein [Chloroflexota bacterium]